MTELVWGKIEDRSYESGISRAVLFPLGGPGVAWNGLVSVEESFDGGEIESYSFEGIKYLDVKASTTYQSKIKAFSAPPEFDPCIGIRSIVPGFKLTRQPKVRFGLVYRTEVNTSDYKIHLVYNALATPSDISYQTQGQTRTPTDLEWTIDAVPPPAVGYKPTAHFVIDSRFTDYRTLAVLEQHIYGVPTNVPHLPDQNFLIELGKADPDVIDGGSSSSSTPDILDGGSSSASSASVVDGRRSSTRPLREFVYS